MGLLTTESRKKWAVHRQKLEALSENNRAITEIIDSACFILCLDTAGVKTGADADASVAQDCGNMLHGTYAMHERSGALVQSGSCCNRWYDKHQIIVTTDGTAGINFEHSATDGHTMLRFVSDVYADTVVNFARSITATARGKDYLQPIIPVNYKRPTDDAGPRSGPRKMAWDVDGEITQAVRYAETCISDQIVQNEVVTLDFKACECSRSAWAVTASATLTADRCCEQTAGTGSSRSAARRTPSSRSRCRWPTSRSTASSPRRTRRS